MAAASPPNAIRAAMMQPVQPASRAKMQPAACVRVKSAHHVIALNAAASAPSANLVRRGNAASVPAKNARHAVSVLSKSVMAASVISSLAEIAQLVGAPAAVAQLAVVLAAVVLAVVVLAVVPVASGPAVRVASVKQRCASSAAHCADAI
jgi:hypothetical protein